MEENRTDAALVCADKLDAARAEIGRLRVVVRVNGLRYGASDADIDRVLNAGGTDQVAAVPERWLRAAVTLINALAQDGITLDGCADPQDMMTELAEYLGCGGADDTWRAAVVAVGSTAA